MKRYLLFYLLLSPLVFADCLQSLGANKIENDYAQFFNAYRVPGGYLVEVISPWEKSQEKYRYLLTRKGTHIPNDCRKLQRIEIPVKRVTTFSTSHLPAIAELGELDSVVGVVDIRHISNERVQKRARAGKITELGHPINMEKVLGIGSDLVMAFVAESPEIEGTARLQSLKIPLVYNADYREKHPLGRAEWIKYMSYFYDKENIAADFYKKIVNNYRKYALITRGVKTRPTILLGENIEGKWTSAGGKSYLAHFISEAGGRYLWESDKTLTPISHPFELVYAMATKVDKWIVINGWKSMNSPVQKDSRYLQFVKSEIELYNGNRKLNGRGGNDYFETGAMRPDLILLDFIKMIHPNKLKKHQLNWFNKLK